MFQSWTCRCSFDSRSFSSRTSRIVSRPFFIPASGPARSWPILEVFARVEPVGLDDLTDGVDLHVLSPRTDAPWRDRTSTRRSPISNRLLLHLLDSRLLDPRHRDLGPLDQARAIGLRGLEEDGLFNLLPVHLDDFGEACGGRRNLHFRLVQHPQAAERERRPPLGLGLGLHHRVGALLATKTR